MSWLDSLRFDAAGLVPVVAQDAATGEVLMLAHANRAALERTLETKVAHYWSRSRGELWEKGATSGNRQEVRDVRVDCDGDSILYLVRPHGPACHTLERSCFHRAVEREQLVQSPGGGALLHRLEHLVRERDEMRPEGSYSSYLFEKGLDKALKKLGEESTETVIAAKNGDSSELAAEVADLLFHLLVVLRIGRLPLAEVWDELDRRFGRGGRPPSAERPPHPHS